MRVVIIGGGEAGSALAQCLSSDHDVIIIEQKKTLATTISAEIDGSVVCGSGVSVPVLRSAEVEQAGLLAAVTENDEVNMVACMLAKALGADKTVARLRSPEYINGRHILRAQLSAAIDLAIHPEQHAAEEIVRYIVNPALLQKDSCINGRMTVYGYRVQEDFPYLNASIDAVRLPRGSRLCAIMRNGRLMSGSGQMLRQDDILYLACPAGRDVADAWGAPQAKAKRVVIAGGGRVGYLLAGLLEQRAGLHKIILAEIKRQRCEDLSEKFSRTQVYHGDITQRSFRDALRIAEADIFVALTGCAERNLMIAQLAAKAGVKRTVSVVTREEHRQIYHSLGVDHTVDLHRQASEAIARLLEKACGHAPFTYAGSRVQLRELCLPRSSPLVDKKIDPDTLPQGMLPIAIVRQGQINELRRGERIRAGDHLVFLEINGLSSVLHESMSAKNIVSVGLPRLRFPSMEKKR